MTYAFWEHVLWEQGLNIWPLSCTRMKALEPLSSVTYLPSCCLLELILRRREASLGEVDGDKEGNPLKGGLKAEEEAGVSSAVHTALSPLSLFFCPP